MKDWIERVGAEKAESIKNQAAVRGTKFHNLVESYLNNKENILAGAMPDMKMMFRKSQKIIDNIDNVEYIEVSLFSELLKVAGTTDIIGEYEGFESVIDLKSSRKTKKESHIQGYFEQVTAYSLMFEELTGRRINRIVVIIGVDDEDAQVFVRDRRHYVDALKKKLDKYHGTWTN